MAYKILHGNAPAYLQEDFNLHTQQSSMDLRPGSGRDGLMFALNPGDTQNARLSTRIQREWNALSFTTRSCTTVTLFKKRLKTELYLQF